MSDENLEGTPPEIRANAEALAKSHLLPKMSRQVYEKAYSHFLAWKAEKSLGKNVPIKTTENVLLAYFGELSQTKKVSSLWACYSMLKSTISVNEGINLASFPKIKALIKTTGKGHIPKKASVFTGGDIKKFLDEAPDDNFLDMKVVAIMGICGACRKTELLRMEVNHLRMPTENMMIVSIPVTKNDKPRSFVVEEPAMINLVLKYQNLRPAHAINPCFFLNYRKGQCSVQVIGKNKLAKMPQQIAKFLNLPNPSSYTGHSFRRTSATLLADSGANIMVLKRHGGWASDTVAEGYVADSNANKRATASLISTNIMGPTHNSKQEATAEKVVNVNISNNSNVTINLNL